jgi:hypothetical protein
VDPAADLLPWLSKFCWRLPICLGDRLRDREPAKTQANPAAFEQRGVTASRCDAWAMTCRRPAENARAANAKPASAGG